VDAGPFQAGDDPGSGLEESERDLMAGAAISGMGDLVWRYVTTEDPNTAAALLDVLRRGIELDGERREDQATRIINALAHSLNKKGTTHRHG
jgi:hypothetical protein